MIPGSNSTFINSSNKTNFFFNISQWRSTTVSLETWNPCSAQNQLPNLEDVWYLRIIYTWVCGDKEINFLFESSTQYLMSERSKIVKVISTWREEKLSQDHISNQPYFVYCIIFINLTNKWSLINIPIAKREDVPTHSWHEIEGVKCRQLIGYIKHT